MTDLSYQRSFASAQQAWDYMEDPRLNRLPECEHEWEAYIPGKVWECTRCEKRAGWREMLLKHGGIPE
jgi:hypothetical protein